MRRSPVKLFILSCTFLFVHLAEAQLFTVDINGAARSDTTAPGFTRWDLPSVISSDGRSAFQSFTNYVYDYDPDTGLPIATNIGAIVRCKLAQTYPTAANLTIYLKADYVNKEGNTTSADPNDGFRLSMDGCRVHWKDDLAVPKIDMPYTNGGAFSLTFSNLLAGVHTITTYHNDYFAKEAWHGAGLMSK